MRETRDIIYILRSGLYKMLLNKYFWWDYKLIWKDTVVTRFHKHITCKLSDHEYIEREYIFCKRCGKDIDYYEFKIWKRDNKINKILKR